MMLDIILIVVYPGQAMSPDYTDWPCCIAEPLALTWLPVMSDDELSSIPNLISPTSTTSTNTNTTVLSPTEQSGPLSLTLTSEASEVTTPAIQDPHLDYDDQLELTQVRKEGPLGFHC